MLKVFTFSFSSQYMDGFYQVVAQDEESAYKLLGISRRFELELVSCFPAPSSDEPRVVFSREIDNPAYEG